jgi:ubiquinone biosynthesis monooxygenase Coq6
LSSAFVPLVALVRVGQPKRGRRAAGRAAMAGRLLCSAAARPPRPVDVVILGGGLVGGALATAVSSNPLSRALSVAVVDPSPPAPRAADAPPARPSLRTSTVSPSSARFLAEVGVWARVPPARIARFRDMVVWDRLGTAGGGPGLVRFDAADMADGNELGFVVDNDTLRAAVFERLRELAKEADVRVVQSTVQSIAWSAEGEGPKTDASASDSAPWPTVHLENGESLSARLIVAADGSRSRVRTLARFDWYSHAYDQTAVVANVKLDRPVTTAYQRFLSTGPIALLPVASDAVDGPMANIIWSTTPAEAEALSAVDDIVFLDELNAALRDADDGVSRVDDRDPVEAQVLSASETVAGKDGGGPLHLPRCVGVVGVRGRFPLSVGHAPRYVDSTQRTVLVGDAAHNVHPLAGQGVNLGFADARSLAGAIARAAATGRDVGGEQGAPLMRYERDRVAANVAMMGTLHAIQAVFGQTSSPVFNFARRLGVSALDGLPPVKKMILRVMS